MPSPVKAIWGSELSPFSLKLRALCAAAGAAYRWLPADGGRLENLQAMMRIEWAKRNRTAMRPPRLTELDEYPLVPFLLAGDGRVYYDSSALAGWLDEVQPPPAGALVPAEPAVGFVARLIDEAFDEFGLYMVHHNRWVVSARRNDAGVRLAREFRHVLPLGLQTGMARTFARRQVRRLPYLFSVAPPGFALGGMPPGLTPPSRPGFPPTHALLDRAWLAHLDALEPLLGERPFLFGERFTVADASVYGALGMNLKDPEACELLQRRAPRTYGWLCQVRDDRHAGARGAIDLGAHLTPLLRVVATTFVPLMQRNETAYAEALRRGETLFNEKAFDVGRALYDGELEGQSFRSVVKTFQVQVWRDLRAAWAALDPADRRRVALVSGEDPEQWFRPA